MNSLLGDNLVSLNKAGYDGDLNNLPAGYYIRVLTEGYTNGPVPEGTSTYDTILVMMQGSYGIQVLFMRNNSIYFRTGAPLGNWYKIAG